MKKLNISIKSMEKPVIDSKNVYYPPGGILMWIIIYLELITFCIALGAMFLSAREEPEVFHESRLLLNTAFGAINTLFLLTSGFFMAKTVHAIKSGNFSGASKFLNITFLGGVLFLLLKGFEYWEKLEAGLTLAYNTFFTYYWMLTLFHVVHVLVGLIVLLTIKRSLSKDPTQLRMEDVEASATFWHMCDIIWLLLFPIIYLVF